MPSCIKSISYFFPVFVPQSAFLFLILRQRPRTLLMLKWWTLKMNYLSSLPQWSESRPVRSVSPTLPFIAGRSSHCLGGCLYLHLGLYASWIAGVDDGTLLQLLSIRRKKKKEKRKRERKKKREVTSKDGKNKEVKRENIEKRKA